MGLWHRYLLWRTRRARPVLTLGERAARYGAAAFLLGVAIAAVPVAQGWREARATMAAEGALVVTWDGAEGVEALRRLGAMMAVGTPPEAP